MTTEAATTNSESIQVVEFLSALVRSDFIEVREIDVQRVRSIYNQFIPANDTERIARFVAEHQEADIYFGVASRRSSHNGTLSGCGNVWALWVDIDFKDQSEADSRRKLDRFQLEPSIVINSGGGLHVYWLLHTPYDLQNDPGTFKAFLRQLATALGADLSSAEPARILRIPGTFNQKYQPPRTVTIEIFRPKQQYALDDFDFLPEEPTGDSVTRDEAQNQNFHELGLFFDRDEILRRAAAYLEKVPPAIEGQNGDNHTFVTACRVVRGLDLSDDEAMAVFSLWNKECQPPWSEPELLKKIRGGRKYGKEPLGGMLEDPGLRPSGTDASPVTKTRTSLWPESPDEAAYCGIAGEIVHLIDPHTEADLVAILIQILIGYGNLINRNAHFIVDGTFHHTNMNGVLVGPTALGRKGTAMSQAMRPLALVDEAWRNGCVKSGLSSGEGLIFAVRDPLVKKEPIKQRGKVTGYQEVIADHGVEDKRLLVVESEFASTLKVMAREGNTLSAVIRQAWDSGHLNTITKNNPVRATDAHISVVGHITKDELRRYMDSTEVANGFANRFLWLCVKRSKLLPHGGESEALEFNPLIQKLEKAVEFGRKAGITVFDAGARKAWELVYPDLSEGGSGLFGTVTSRAAAQVRRLALIYALLDCSDDIRLPHLRAALALWGFAEASAKFIFGDALGDPVADEILRMLQGNPNGVTRTDISSMFGRHKKSVQIGTALVALQERGLARCVLETTDGRSVERWLRV